MRKLNRMIEPKRLLGDAEFITLLHKIAFMTGGIERMRNTKNPLIFTFPKIPTMSLHIYNAVDKEHGHA